MKAIKIGFIQIHISNTAMAICFFDKYMFSDVGGYEKLK
jgi:hypothetical protein